MIFLWFKARKQYFKQPQKDLSEDFSHIEADIRALIDKIIITVSKQGNTEIALHGELDALLHFMTATEDQKTAENKGLQNAKSRPSSKEGRLYRGGPRK
ncbi:MAG: hypothetical protein COA85_13360 [Robiginitomaculum sp.]|nr:MAG: hypothetical protein COA85_13360 [Robiginitomaculum sp.]